MNEFVTLNVPKHMVDIVFNAVLTRGLTPFKERNEAVRDFLQNLWDNEVSVPFKRDALWVPEFREKMNILKVSYQQDLHEWNIPESLVENEGDDE